MKSRIFLASGLSVGGYSALFSALPLSLPRKALLGVCANWGLVKLVLCLVVLGAPFFVFMAEMCSLWSSWKVLMHIYRQKLI